MYRNEGQFKESTFGMLSHRDESIRDINNLTSIILFVVEGPESACGVELDCSVLFVSLPLTDCEPTLCSPFTKSFQEAVGRSLPCMPQPACSNDVASPPTRRLMTKKRCPTRPVSRRVGRITGWVRGCIYVGVSASASSVVHIISHTP